MLTLSGVSAKIDRAAEHAQAVKDEISTWIDGNPYKASPIVSADSKRYSVIHNVITPPKLERWALMSGDYFHNLRSALDHLVYAIAVHVTGQDPPPRERKWAFPVADSTCSDFSAKRSRIDPGNILGDIVWAAIQDVQPCNRPHPELPPLLRLLEDFDNADKHRLLQWAIEDQVAGEITNIRREDGGPLPIPVVAIERNPKHGAEIVSITFPVPTPNVHYSYDSLVTLSLRHEAGPNGINRTDIGLIFDFLWIETSSVIKDVAAKIV